MVRVTLLLGTNEGDREENLRLATESLSRVFYSAPVDSTPVIETEAVGFEGSAFLNQLVQYETEMEAEDVLNAAKNIEAAMGRREVVEYDAEGRRIYHNRPIDIDILFFGEEKMATERLVIPHPQVYSRPFVKELLEMLNNY